MHVHVHVFLTASDGLELEKLPKVTVLRNNRREGRGMSDCDNNCLYLYMYVVVNVLQDLCVRE